MRQQPEAPRRAARGPSARAGEFLIIALKLWPFYLGAPVVVGVAALIAGESAEAALRFAVDILVFAVLVGPMGDIAYNQWGDVRHQFALLGFAALWVLCWLPIAVLVLERYGS